jgi:cytochrome b6-f complex iron-sulfur subunit
MSMAQKAPHEPQELHVVSQQPGPTNRVDCDGCSRRLLLQGIGVAAVGLVVLGCGQSGSSEATASTTACGSATCIDLGDPANAKLAAVGGAMLVDTANDTVMVIRTSATEVIALSAICTHSGCSMDFDASRNLLTCPCHGSEFDESGAVTRGPANRALRVYTASLAGNVITLQA